MAEFVPFSSVHYNPDKFPNISDLVSPPYDMVDKNLKMEMIKKHYNFSHLTVPEGDDAASKYKISVHKLFGWLLRDVLIIDKSPVYYLQEQTIQMESMVYKRFGVIGLLKIEEYGKNIKKHEQVNEKLVNDRYSIMKETQCNLESIYCLYKDEKKELNQKIKTGIGSLPVMFEFTDSDGILNRIYRLNNEELIHSIFLFFKNKDAYIADGVNRYEAALKYKNDMKKAAGEKYTGKEPFNYTMVHFYNVFDDAMMIMPVNRLVKKTKFGTAEILKMIEKKYKIGAISFQDLKMEKLARTKIRTLMNENKINKLVSFGLYFNSSPTRYFLITLKEEIKDDPPEVNILEKTILSDLVNKQVPGTDEMVGFESNDNKTYELVKSGEYDMAFIINSISLKKVLEFADKNILLPYNSTYFYPKIFSGSVLFSYRYSTIKYM